MDSSGRTLESVRKIINDYLKKHNIFDENAPWELRASSLGGFGLFARRNINPGEIIFLDRPILLGPKWLQKPSNVGCAVCSSNDNLKLCPFNCGLAVCSKGCELSLEHRKECQLIQSLQTTSKTSSDVNNNNSEENGGVGSLTNDLVRCLTPLRSLLLSEEDKKVVKVLKSHKGPQHEFEVDLLLNELKFDIKKDDVDFMRFTCMVLDANAFELTVGDDQNPRLLRGLFPLGSLGNHRCYSNIFHVFDDKQRMVTRASVFIPENSEMFNTYCRIIWGTPTRMFHLLKTKHFLCKCDRCADPTEFGTYMGALTCQKCRGMLVSTNPLRHTALWQCEDCKDKITARNAGQTLTLLGSVLKSFDSNDIGLMLQFLRGKLTSMAPKTNQIAVELKYRVIWILGYQEGFKWKDLSVELLSTKISLCKDILEILRKLKVGQCKMRGLLLFEIHECLVEIQSRKEASKRSVNKEFQFQDDLDDDPCQYLKEATDILGYDVSAPQSIKDKRNSTINQQRYQKINV